MRGDRFLVHSCLEKFQVPPKGFSKVFLKGQVSRECFRVWDQLVYNSLADGEAAQWCDGVLRVSMISP